MKRASDVLREDQQKRRLTTGSGDLDALIDGVVQGHFYLFYSNHQRILDSLVHRLLVNCVLPLEHGGYDAQALYFNICNYHQGKTLLDPSRLAMMAKSAGIDPATAFDNIHSVSAFNEIQQASASRKVVDFVKRNRHVKLVVIHNLTRFIETSRKPFQAREQLKQVIGVLKHVTEEHEVALVVSGSAFQSRRHIPKPLGGTFLRHEANVVVLLKRYVGGFSASVKVTLVKHPYKRTPHTVTLHAPTEGITLTGRVTPTFTQRFETQINALKRSGGFQTSLTQLQHKQAFERLIEEAWMAEVPAMSNARLPHLIDVLNLMANTHNMGCVAELRQKLSTLKGINPR